MTFHYKRGSGIIGCANLIHLLGLLFSCLFYSRHTVLSKSFEPDRKRRILLCCIDTLLAARLFRAMAVQIDQNAHFFPKQLGQVAAIS